MPSCDTSSAGQAVSGLAVTFAAGHRPGVAEIAHLAAEGGQSHPSRIGFAITHQPEKVEGWLELLAGGLTFDLSGLAPAKALDSPLPGRHFGLPSDFVSNTDEAIRLVPGPHLAGGGALLPVVRMMVAIGSNLAGLAGVRAVSWLPAATWIEPILFSRMADQWLAGGAFPALGLTALNRRADGIVETHGLAFFIGRECRFSADLTASPEATAKLAVRVIHMLVEGPALVQATVITGPDGEEFIARPGTHDGWIHIERAA